MMLSSQICVYALMLCVVSFTDAGTAFTVLHYHASNVIAIISTMGLHHSTKSGLSVQEALQYFFLDMLYISVMFNSGIAGWGGGVQTP